MSGANNQDVDKLLSALPGGDAEGVAELIPLVYAELHDIASIYLRGERPDHTLQPTALVNEAYLRLAAQRTVEWKSKSHFLGIAAQAMRRILVDHARRHRATKRGGGNFVTLDEGVVGEDAQLLDVIALHEALTGLSAVDERQGRIVELRFFGGLDVPQTAELLGISPATVKREWRVARAWLRRELAEAGAGDTEALP